MREAYRLHQSLWHNGRGMEAVWMYVGRPDTSPRFEDIQGSIRTLMKKAATETAP